MRKAVFGIVIAFAFIPGTLTAGAQLVVTPAVTSVSAGSKQQFSASTMGATPAVYWTVSGIGCSGSGCGNITLTGGLYSAPVKVSSPLSVTVTAYSTKSFSTTGSLTFTVGSSGSGGGSVTVSISPPTSTQLNAGQSETFSATVSGTTNQAVTWSVGGSGCSGNCGTINSTTGMYTAPASLSRSLSATITATSQANPSASASVVIQLISAVAVSIGQFNSQVAPGGSEQFLATVTGTTQQTVKWSVSCTGSSCGTISSSGLYKAPASVGSSLNVTVKATAVADATKFATAAITVGPIVTVAVAPTTLSISIKADQQFAATVTGASNPMLNWTVSGPGCSGMTCGLVSPLTLNGSTALYQAPPSIPAPATVTITASLASDSTKFGSTTVTIVPLSDGRLNGQYAFLFKGFDASGPYHAVGSFTADGNGNLSGIEDINCGAGKTDTICASGAVLGQSFTGTYIVNADGRGTFTITPSGGAPIQTFTMAVSATNAKARFIESDMTTGIRGSGVLELQTPAAFSTSVLAMQRYAFSLSGVDSAGNPIGAIGAMGFTIPTGTTTTEIVSGVLTVNDNGVLACYPPVAPACPSAGPALQQFSGIYGTIDSNGRGAATFSVQGFDGNSADTTTFNFSMYVVSSTEFFLLSTDDPGATTTKNPVFSGQAIEPQIPNGTTAFQQGKAVFDWTGVTSGSPAVPQAAAGQVVLDGNGGVTSFYYDINSGGAITGSQDYGICPGTGTVCSYTTQTYGFMLVSDGKTSFRVYPTAPNTGFLLGTGNANSLLHIPPSVQIGEMAAQSVTVPQPFMFGSGLMIAPNAPLVSGTASLNSVAFQGTVSGNEDESLTSGFTSNLPFNGTYSPPTLPNGNGSMFLGSTTSPTYDFWVINASKTVAVDFESGSVPNLVVLEH